MAKTKACATCTSVLPDTTDFFHSRGSGRTHGDCKSCRAKKRVGKKVEIPPTDVPSKIEQASKYIITYAQNATPVHLPFLRSIERYAEYNGAQIIVIAGRYRNPTSVFTERSHSDEWWDESVVEYIFRGEHKINANISIFGDVSIQPTATRPLSGLEGHVQNQSGIFGHPKIELKTIATDKRQWPRILTTTGACTKSNYTDSKAGKKGEKSHTLGAVVVEVDGKRFHLRHVTAARDGTFQDLNRLYSPDTVVDGARIEALICGDIHAAHADPDVDAATFTSDVSIVNTLRPRNIVYHDILSMTSRPKYGANMLTSTYSRYVSGNGSVKDEINAAIGHVETMTPDWATGHVVQSNHDDHLLHWLNTAEIRFDPENAITFHNLWLMMLQAYSEDGRWTSPLRLWHDEMKREKKRLRFVTDDEQLKIAGHSCQFHGHAGVNGARGTIGQYAKLGVKTVIGHSHSPGIQDNCMQVGVSGSLDQNYNKLPSSWFHAHGILYANGTRTLVFVVDGKWRS